MKTYLLILLLLFSGCQYNVMVDEVVILISVECEIEVTDE